MQTNVERELSTWMLLFRMTSAINKPYRSRKWQNEWEKWNRKVPPYFFLSLFNFLTCARSISLAGTTNLQMLIIDQTDSRWNTYRGEQFLIPHLRAS